MRHIRLFPSLSLALICTALTTQGCGPEPDKPVDMEFTTGDGVAHRVQGIWGTVPYGDPMAGVPYKIKVGDITGKPFGSDLLSGGPYPDGYPMPTDPRACFWQRSYLKADGTPQADCICRVAVATPDWASSFHVDPSPPGGTSPINLMIRFPGASVTLYAPCYDRADRGYILNSAGKVVYMGP